jgi:hypothetical protein
VFISDLSPGHAVHLKVEAVDGSTESSGSSAGWRVEIFQTNGARFERWRWRCERKVDWAAGQRNFWPNFRTRKADQFTPLDDSATWKIIGDSHVT